MQIARVTVSANLLERWIEDVEVKNMLNLLRSTIKLPSRRTLDGSLLSKLLDEAQREAKSDLRGKSVTLAVDGWKHFRQDCLVSFVVKDHRKIYTVEVVDITDRPKNGTEMFRLIESRIQNLNGDDWAMLVIAFCTDDGSVTY